MPNDSPEERVLVIAPVGQDACAMADVLANRGFATQICGNATECCALLGSGAGTLLLTEEALETPDAFQLLGTLKNQPPWSELPLIILTTGGESRLTKLLNLAAEAAGGVTLLERPIGTNTLLRSVEVGLKSRRRQYQVRDLLEEQRQHAVALEQVVAERTADLRATNEQLETFVYSVAHDLRAPLRSITGYSQLLLDDYAATLDESARQLLKRVQASSEFMDKLLLDLLAYGRTARADIELARVELHTAWETALFQCATLIDQTGAQVTAADSLPAVLAHQATLGQCLTNLLSNALKFVRSEIRPEIRFSAQDCGDRVRLWVQDNGIGIPPNQHERIFRVFERLHGSQFPGTGIGLSIVRKGIERMGGRVGLDSEPGHGSRFWIELPKAQVVAHRARIDA